MHQLEHLDLTDKQVSAQIRQAYKKYTNLKNDKGRCDHWLAELIAAQAQTTIIPLEILPVKCLSQGRFQGCT